jgi:hypothetical protein
VGVVLLDMEMTQDRAIRLYGGQRVFLWKITLPFDWMLKRVRAKEVRHGSS